MKNAFSTDFILVLKRHWCQICGLNFQQPSEMWSGQWLQHIQVWKCVNRKPVRQWHEPWSWGLRFSCKSSPCGGTWGLSHCQCTYKQWERLLTIDISSRGLRLRLQHTQGMEGGGRVPSWQSQDCLGNSLSSWVPCDKRSQVMFSLWHYYTSLWPNSSPKLT